MNIYWFSDLVNGCTYLVIISPNEDAAWESLRLFVKGRVLPGEYELVGVNPMIEGVVGVINSPYDIRLINGDMVESLK